MYKSYFFLEGPPHSDAFQLTATQAAHAIAQALPTALGYTQTRTLREQIDDDALPPYTGIAEVWFANREEALGSLAQVEALSELLSPETRSGPIVTGRARTVMRLPEHHQGNFVKGVFGFRRQDRLGISEFQRYWWLNHGPIAARTEGAVYYLQCHPLTETYSPGTPPFDGITELHWASVEVARASMASAQMTRDQSKDAENFVEPGSVVLFLAGEEVVIAA